MAGLGRRTFAAGEVLTASNVMAYLQDQAVMNFAGTAARGSAIGSAVSEGMVSYLADSNMIETYSGTAWERQSGGLVPLSPTTVTFVTGSGTVSSIGVMSFTGCSAVRIDGVFDSKYKNYRVLINYSGNLNPNVPSFRLRASGTDNTANAYYYSGYSARTTGSVGLWAGNGVSFVDLGRCNTTASATSIDFYNPFQATNTPYSFNSAQYDNTGLLSQNVNGIHYASTAYDGFSFHDTAGGGVLSGTLQVFGYND